VYKDYLNYLLFVADVSGAVAMNNRRVIKSLRSLCRIVEAGEKGYAVSAANITSPGLKILLRSFAQQRARFKNEILAEISNLGGDTHLRSSLRGAIHRGRINIFAALANGNEERERVVLKEILVGENAALRAYETTLRKSLHPNLLSMLEFQYEVLLKLVEQIRLLNGQGRRRMVVHLFDSESNIEAALRELYYAGFDLKGIQKIPFGDGVEIYDGRGATIQETVLSGAVGGALWGSLIGAIAGFGVEEIYGAAPPEMLPIYGLWALVALAAISGGALVGSLLGYALGTGIAEEDVVQYGHGMAQGQILLLSLVESSRVKEAGWIMRQVNSQAWAKTNPAPA
jgi:uncharacterized protein (TIGR02284 family)